MNRPSDIPNEVWEAARSAVCGFMAMNTSSFPIVVRCARVILAAKAEEREACALIAEEFGQYQVSYEIAAAIRKRGES